MGLRGDLDRGVEDAYRVCEGMFQWIYLYLWILGFELLEIWLSNLSWGVRSDYYWRI